jgi:probable HAF family extracellular repeat protein
MGKVSIAFLVILFLLFPVAAGAYSAVELGVLAQGAPVVIRGLSDDGDVAGSGVLANGPRAFVLDPGGLRTIDPGPPSDHGIANAITRNGVVVGTLNGSSAVRAFRWTAAGGIDMLPPLAGDSGSEAFGINTPGAAVGLSAGPPGTRAVRWGPTGTPELLDALPNVTDSRALAINQAGTAVGVSGNRAVVWLKNAASELQALEAGEPSEALSINAGGQIVGSSGPLASRHAVLWDGGAAPRDLGILAGGAASRAVSINDAGQVVGTSDTTSGNRAVLWAGGSAPQDLNGLVTGLTGVVLTHAVAINNPGVILAIGHDDTGHGTGDAHEDHELPLRVFLLLPAP